MKGRTLYVVPYCMGPIDSPYSRCGVEITDSAYVVINMSIMTRMGRPALERIARDGKFVKGLHSIGELDPNRRFIMHFPEELSIESFGSGYGGNALARQEMPCAAHRELAGARRRLAGRTHAHRRASKIPQGETHYIAAAFPSACGKTNLAMLIPPDSMPGWKIWTVGDDIAWLHPGPGRPPVRHQSGGGLFRRRAGHQSRDQSQRVRHDPPRHVVHQCRADGGQRAVVGRPQAQHAGARLAGQALRCGQRRRVRASEFALHRLRHQQPYLLSA